MKKLAAYQKDFFLSVTLVFIQYSAVAAGDNSPLFSTIGAVGQSPCPNTLVIVDSQTGNQAQRGPQGGTPWQTSLDWDPTSGFFFGTNYRNGKGVITKINPYNGQWTEFVTIRFDSVPVNLTALSFSPDGKLYGITDFITFGLINLSQSIFSPIATLNIPGLSEGMDFSPQGVLYLTDSFGQGDTYQHCLRTINPLTGEIISTLSIGGFCVEDMDFASDGYIYHTNRSWYMFKLDPVTGEQSVLNSTGIYGVFGGVASIPEPCTILLFGLGARLCLTASPRRAALIRKQR